MENLELTIFILVMGIAIVGIIGISLFFYQPEYYESKTSISPSILNGEKEVFDSFSNKEALHYPSMPIKYKIDSEPLGDWQKELLYKAFDTITKETDGFVSFKEVEENPNLIIYYKTYYKEDSELNESWVDDFTLATGSYSTSIDNENLVELGEVTFYQGMKCKTGYPDLEVHEIMHTFGFNHSPISSSVMSEYSQSYNECEVNGLDEYMIQKLKWVYDTTGTIGLPDESKHNYINENLPLPPNVIPIQPPEIIDYSW